MTLNQLVREQQHETVLQCVELKCLYFSELLNP